MAVVRRKYDALLPVHLHVQNPLNSDPQSRTGIIVERLYSVIALMNQYGDGAKNIGRQSSIPPPTRTTIIDLSSANNWHEGDR